MSDDVVITFDSPADVWRVKRGDVTAEIPLVEMTNEYYRWQREYPALAGLGDAWRVHAEAFCLRRLEASVSPPPGQEAKS